MSSSAVFENTNNANYEMALLQKKRAQKSRIFSCAAHKIKKFLSKFKSRKPSPPADRLVVCQTPEELENALNEALESGAAFQRVVFLDPADLDICLRGQLTCSLFQAPEKQSPC